MGVSWVLPSGTSSTGHSVGILINKDCSIPNCHTENIFIVEIIKHVHSKKKELFLYNSINTFHSDLFTKVLK